MTKRWFVSYQSKCTSVLLVLLFAILCCTASAEAPMAQTQAPGYYRFMLGQYEVTALYDGSIDMDTGLLRNTTSQEIQDLLTRACVTGPIVPGSVNAYLINTGTRLVLIDTGAATLFGPTLGKMALNLKASGYNPAQIDAVFITHLHGDHFGGLLDSQGKLTFPKATVYVAKPEGDFWLSPEVAAGAPEAVKAYFKMAVDIASPCLAQGRWKTITGGETPIQGIKALITSGHTPGHTVYEIRSGDQKMVVVGDIIHIGAVQFAKPKTSITFDVDQTQAVAARLALFKRLASETTTFVAGMHLPFPGIGHVRQDGPDAYSWVPIQFGPVK